ncbi:MAG: SDR family oxidoreductase [Clostridia bacterium]|nr:SDR family oxidoreductase [Clostridia bacterium]
MRVELLFQEEGVEWISRSPRSRRPHGGWAYPLGRLGRPADVAAAVVFLASAKASFITGQTLSVSGGYRMM